MVQGLVESSVAGCGRRETKPTLLSVEGGESQRTVFQRVRAPRCRGKLPVGTTLSAGDVFAHQSPAMFPKAL